MMMVVSFLQDYTPLMEASRTGNGAMIRLLMEFGADPNTVNSVS